MPRGDENLVQVVDAEGGWSRHRRTCAVSRASATLEPGPSGYAARNGGPRSREGDGPFRVVARRVTTEAGTYTVYVAGSLEGVDESTTA